jgi:N4-gp56 family major capsid protein
MAVTTSAGLTNSVVTQYDKVYLENFMNSRIWWEFVNWKKEVGNDLKGKTITTPVIEPIAPNTTALTESSDRDPTSLADDALSMTIYEYGDVVQTTHFLGVTAFTDVEKGAAKVIGKSQAESIDKVIRNVGVGGTLVMYPGAVTARASLDATNDKIDWEFINQLYAMAVSLGIEPFEDGSYASIIHPIMIPDIRDLLENVGTYADPTVIYTGQPGQVAGGAKFRGEIGKIGRVRFIAHKHGKLYLGEGTDAQTATDLDGAVTAGATSITVTSATGIAVGDWITIDEGETTAEQVLVTAVSGADITVRGGGNKRTNLGLKYAHADEATVSEAPNVAAVPILGPSSIYGRFATDPGKNGRASVEYKSTNIPKRFLNHSWYWVGGFAIDQKNILRGEVAVSSGIYGDN